MVLPHPPIGSPSRCAPACPQPDPSELPLQGADPGGERAAMGEQTNSHGPHSCQWACSLPQPLLPAQAYITTCVAASTFFRWPLQMYMHTWGPQQFSQPIRPPILATDHTVVNAVDSSSLSWRDITAPQNNCCHMSPHLYSAPLDTRSCSAPAYPHPQVKGFPYWSQSKSLEELTASSNGQTPMQGCRDHEDSGKCNSTKEKQ